MVVRRLPRAALTGVTHERTGAPSRCTVQAPHSAMPQPYLVPVRPTMSRNTHSSGISPSTSRVVFLPLRLSVIIRSHGPRRAADAYYTAAHARGAAARPKGRARAAPRRTLYNA